MKRKIASTIFGLAGFLLFLLCSPQCSFAQGLLNFQNKHLRMQFDSKTGTLLNLQDLKTAQTIIQQTATKETSLFEIELVADGKKQLFTAADAGSFSFQEGKSLQLVWSGFNGLPTAFKVVAHVQLEQNRPFSQWRIAVEGTQGVSLAKVVFPRIQQVQDLGQEELVIPEWMGSLTRDPRGYYAVNPKTTLSLNYPDHLAMQFMALYNPNKIGFYFASNDTQSYAKRFVATFNQQKQAGFELVHFPEYVSTNSRYAPNYASIIGTFEGDWQDVAAIYGEWGRKQHWAKESRLSTGKVTPWIKNTAAWVWNRGQATNVLDPAMELKDQLKLPVSVLWHWWHGGSYDDSFPDYFPPRDGAAFTPAIDRAKQQDVHALVYMNQLKWGDSQPSWQNEKAYLWATKNIEGKHESHMYNIFTKKSLTYMCLATDFWKNKYAALVDSAINKYHVSGIYMDQTCLSRVCYDPTHNHPVGGGKYWLEHVKQRDQLNRAQPKDPKAAAFAGEGAGEAWLPYIDAFLTLGVSKERYAGVKGPETIPLFQAVYHEYGITFGNYSSLLTPPYDEKWPKEFAPDNAETLLDAGFNGQFLIEQARSFVWGMQPMIANYQPYLQEKRKPEMDFFRKITAVRQQGLKFLLEGQYVKNIKLDVPRADYNMSKLSIYAGQNEKVTTFNNQYPTLYHALWRAKDGNIGLAISNIQDKAYPLQLNLQSKDYQLAKQGKIYRIDPQGRHQICSYQQGKISLQLEISGHDACIIEIGK